MAGAEPRAGAIDLKHPYLTRGLIAYIGNKRALFPFLADAFSRCADDIRGAGAAGGQDRPLRFLDPFAGSGGVSRLGRALGYAVSSNDRERYAALIARCRLVLSPGRLETAFAAEGGSRRAFAALDAFSRGDESEAAALVAAMPDGAARDRWKAAFTAAGGAEPYIARHYAPERTEAADWRSERLFYTAENARFLDRAREAVELLYSLDPLDPSGPLAESSAGGAPDVGAADAKTAFLDAILYEAATRVNTSGVFKACHRGFGGHGKDALSRITSAMRLCPPDLIDGPEARVGSEDAAAFCAALATGGPADIAYLDPPYNQHQYGSNYHLLTTLSRWDRPPVPGDRDGSGFLLDRSGIRADWTETRSDFCRRGRAGAAFSEVLEAIDARFVLVSYSDGGILPLEELRALLEARGSVRVEAVPYVAYRGGKQSASRTERTSELLFVVDTSARGADGRAREELRRIRAQGALEALSKGRFDPRLPAPASCRGVARIRAGGRLELDGAAISRASASALEAAAAALRSRTRATSAEAFDLVLELLGERVSGAGGKRERAALARDALALLAKIAFRKYGAEYGARSAALRAALARGALQGAAGERLLAALDALDSRASLRGVILRARDCGIPAVEAARGAASDLI